MSDITDDTALGGSFGNVGDSQVQTFNNAAAASAAEAAISATNASDSATASANSATASASSAGTSASEATAAAASAAAALVSKNNAATSETNAETAETNAETAETNAGTSATASASSATSASSSATSATSSASGATTSATNAATSATNSGNSATASASSATGAATSATNASNSSGTAATSATNAGNSATAAATSATNSSNSATASSSSASTATTKASEANTSASNASTSASTATTKAGEAATSATNSATSATAAGVARTGAEAARDAALAAFDNFDDKYLGEKSSDPTTDNDGDPLVSGMLYYNTTDNIMKVYTGTSWVAAYASLAGALLVVNNLSDLDDVVPARTNLGLGTAATTAATAYATAAQGTKADAALPKAGGAMSGAITTNSTFDGRDVATDGTKLDGIETNADVTDTANVTSSGALMDSEVTNLAQVKAFDSTDYATAAQGATANAALPKAGGAMTGAITTNSTFDGVDVGTRDAVLTSTTTTANAALPKAGGTMTGPLVVNETTAVTMSAGTTGQRPTGVAGMFRYNTTEDKFEGYSTTWGEIGGGAADLRVNSFTGDGSTVAYTLTTSPDLSNTLAYIDGVYQVKAAYAMSGQTLTFTAAPDSGALIEITAATVAPVQESTDFLLNNFTGNGSTTAFTLSSTPTSENQTSVYLSGVYQNKDSYSVSGTTLTFGVAPPNAVGIEVMVARTVVFSAGTPDDNTVSTVKIQDDAVTSAKVDGTVATVVGTETLTNKTLTAPTINGGTHTAFTSTGIDDNATSTAITIDASENVGIGGTPSAWAATIKAIDLTTGGAVYGTATGVASASNLYNDGNWRAKTTGVGTLYGQSGGVHNWYSSASVSAGAVATLTERMKIDNAGHAIIGGGITLGNGQTYAAANTLDDYEEGDWTAAISGGTQAITNITQARYTKIGRSVLLTAYLTQSTVTNSTELAISGMPFTASSYNATGIVNFATNSSGGTVLCRTAPQSTILRFYKNNANQAGVTQTQNAGHIIFSITYITDQ